MYVALEKRWNFTLHDMDSRAVAFDYWCSLFTEQTGQHFRTTSPAYGHEPMPACAALPVSPSSNSLVAHSHVLQGRKMSLDEVPHILEYSRGNDLELWQLWC